MRQTKRQTDLRGKRRLRRLFKAGIAGVVAVLVVVVLFHFHLGPYLLKRQARQALGRVWDGPIRIAAADFHFTQPCWLYGLELLDRDGNRWLRVGSARLVISGWSSLRPGVKQADLSPVDCDLHFTAGRCRPPLRRPGKTAAAGSLNGVVARDVTVRLMQAGRPVSAATYAGLEIAVHPKAGRYEFALSQPAAKPPETLKLTGAYTPAGRVLQAQLTLDHAATVNETSALFAAFQWKHLAAAQGNVKATASFHGPLDGLGKAKTSLDLLVRDLRLDGPDGIIANDVDLTLSAADGTGRLAAASAAAPLGLLTVSETNFTYSLDPPAAGADKVRATMAFSGADRLSRFWHRILRDFGAAGKLHLAGSIDYRRARAEPVLGELRFTPEALELRRLGKRPLIVRDVKWDSAALTPRDLNLAGLAGRTCQGSFVAQLHVSQWARPERTFSLALSTTDLELLELVRSLRPDDGEAKLKGKMNLDLVLAGRPGTWDGLSGHGKLFIDDGDFWGVPVVGNVFKELRLPVNPARISDAHAVFDLAGAVVAIRRGLVTNKLAGIECPEGTVHLHTRHVDAVVVAATFLDMNKLGSAILGKVKAKLLGRRIRGRWDQIGPKDFIAIPTDKIADASANSLRQLARGGEKLGTGLLKGFEDLFRAITRKKTPKEAPLASKD